MRYPVFLGVRINEDDKERLRRLVEAAGTDMSAVVRGLLRAAKLDDAGETGPVLEEVTTPS